MAVDRALEIALTKAVQDALADDAQERSERGDARLSEAAQEALAMKALREEFRKLDEQRVAQNESRLTRSDEAQLTSTVMASAVGLGAFDLLLADETVEDISATRFDQVFTYHSDGSVRHRQEQFWSSPTDLANSIAHIARTRGRTERQFNSQHPLLTMRIGKGLRLAAQREVSEHVSFTLRRNTLGKVVLSDLVGLGMFPQVIADFLRAIGHAPEMRVAFGGATGAGKTTVARAILNELPPTHRLIVIEDTAELDMFDEHAHPNVESWEQREANSEGEGLIPLGELVKHGLRNRPDLLIVGEVRGADAAIPMLEAMTHGQASITTVHADDALGVLSKLALFLGKGSDRMTRDAAYNNLSQALDFVVHVDRGGDGGRFISEILEISGFDGEQCTTNTVYSAKGGAGRTMNRLTEQHARKLRKAGFDTDRLGSGWR